MKICSECEKSFGRAGNLERHIVNHIDTIQHILVSTAITVICSRLFSVNAHPHPQKLTGAHHVQDYYKGTDKESLIGASPHLVICNARWSSPLSKLANTILLKNSTQDTKT